MKNFEEILQKKKRFFVVVGSLLVYFIWILFDDEVINVKKKVKEMS